MAWTEGDGLTPTNLNTRFPSSMGLSVKDPAYGAVGDGSTNDTAAIQAAIDAAEAAGGGLVYVPAGTYNVTALTIQESGVILYGEGPDRSILKLTSTAGVEVEIPAETLSNVAIRDLQFRLGIAGVSYMLNLVFADTFEMTNVQFDHGSSTYAAGSTIAFRVGESNAGTMRAVSVRATAADPFAVGYDLYSSVTGNRGNLTVMGGLITRCDTAVRIAYSASNLVNNIGLYGVKAKHTTENTTTTGFDLYTQCKNVVLDTIQAESYNLGIRMAGVTDVMVRGAQVSLFEAGVQRGVHLTTACDNVSFDNCRLANNVDTGAGTGFLLDAANHRGIRILNPSFGNVNDPFNDSSTGNLNTVWSQSGDAKRFWFKDDVVCTTFARLGDRSTLTIASGVVTATGSSHRIDTEGAAASDDLDTISVTGDRDFALLVLHPANTARTVVVKNGSGNIQLAGSDCTMENINDTLTLFWTGGVWLELSRSDNGA